MTALIIGLSMYLHLLKPYLFGNLKLPKVAFGQCKNKKC